MFTGFPPTVAATVHVPERAEPPASAFSAPRPRPLPLSSGGIGGGGGGLRSGFSAGAAADRAAVSFGCCIGVVTLIHCPGRTDFTVWSTLSGTVVLTVIV